MHIENMHKMVEDLTSCTKSAIESNKTHVGQYPISEVVDMIKDLSEAEYYAKISKAMEKADEEEQDEEKYMLQRMKEEYGDNAQRYYDEWRYASGRFAPKGRGTRRGYRMTPEMYHANDYMPVEFYRDMDMTDGRMYYTGTGSNQSGNMSSSMNARNYSDGYNDGQTRGYDEGYNKGYSEGQRSGGNRSESRYDRARRNYTETKSTHTSNTAEDNSENMKSLERIMNIIADDVKEYMPHMSQSEKAMARQKLDNMAKSIV